MLFMGKSIISMVIFNSYFDNYQRVMWLYPPFSDTEVCSVSIITVMDGTMAAALDGDEPLAT